MLHWANKLPRVSGRELLQKLDAIKCDGFRGRRQIAPEACGRGDFLDGETKALNHQPSVVVSFVERTEQLGPCHVAAAWCAAVVLACVDVFQVRSERRDCGRNG